MRQAIIVGIFTFYLCSLVSASSDTTNMTNMTTMEMPVYSSIKKLDSLSNQIYCVADYRTKCTTNYTTSCMYLKEQNFTVCGLESIYQTRVTVGPNKYQNSMNQSFGASRIYAGNKTLPSTSQLTESECTMIADKKNSMSCSTKVTSCVEVLSSNSCMAKSTIQLVDISALQASQAQSDKCAKASDLAKAALSTRDNLCLKLNEMTTSADFKKLKKDCQSASNKWYIQSNKRAIACKYLVPVY